jgi:hypothetical protein
MVTSLAAMLRLVIALTLLNMAAVVLSVLIAMLSARADTPKAQAPESHRAGIAVVCE